MNIRLRTPRFIAHPGPGPRPSLRRFVLAALLVTNAAAAGAAYQARTVGDWVVSPSSDQKGCFLSRTYPAPRQTTLQLGLDTDGGNRLTILNVNWSIRPRERLTMDFRLSNAAFPRHVAIGIATQGKKGFVTSFGKTFPTSLAASRVLYVRRGDVPVEELGLDGSGAAIAELRRCVDQYRAPASAPRPARADRDRIPTDPFAAPTARDSRQ